MSKTQITTKQWIFVNPDSSFVQGYNTLREARDDVTDYKTLRRNGSIYETREGGYVYPPNYLTQEEINEIILSVEDEN